MQKTSIFCIRIMWWKIFLMITHFFPKWRLKLNIHCQNLNDFHEVQRVMLRPISFFCNKMHTLSSKIFFIYCFSFSSVFLSFISFILCSSSLNPFLELKPTPKILNNLKRSKACSVSIYWTIQIILEEHAHRGWIVQELWELLRIIFAVLHFALSLLTHLA
jgi:hypothetical protein